MPSSSGCGGSRERKTAQPRRTHKLGGCFTCRRRHVKCDQTRPHCTTCRNAQLQCGGFPSQIRWAPTSTGPPVISASSPVENRVSLQQPARGLAAQVALPENDVRKRTNMAGLASPPSVQQLEHVPGASIPQGADFATPENLMLSPQGGIPGNIEGSSDAAIGSTHSVLPPSDVVPVHDEMPISTHDPAILNHLSSSSLCELGSQLDSSTGLGWNDLFDSALNFTMPSFQDQTYDDPLGLLAHVASQPQDGSAECHFYNRPFISQPFPERGEMVSMTTPPLPQPPPYTPAELNEYEVLEHAKVLLKHFRDSVIPHFGPVPLSCKSPWETLVWNNAVQTHAEMTFLQSDEIKQANKANLFAIIACSAHTITKLQRCPEGLSHLKGIQILDYAAKRAKHHMQESLRMETSGPRKAKYKQQLIAIYSLIALSTFTGDAADARYYIISAERLVRIRGLCKREISRRARLLHHIYTWIRIIGESTFVLHDYSTPGLIAKIEELMRGYIAPSGISPFSEQDSVAAATQNSQLDDFLRVETHEMNDEPDTASSNDQETGLRDIHLSDLRQWSNTLYMEIYGIPEVWLKLVSQTTRVANLLDSLDRTHVQAPRAFTDWMNRKTNRLEHMVCSFSAQHSLSDIAMPGHAGGSQTGTATPRTTPAGRAMLRAMGSALVIFFYRRVRKVHPWILQPYVKEVMIALKDFDLVQDVSDIRLSGTPWPAFIAGCEAMSAVNREWFSTWFRKGETQSTWCSFTSAQDVMRRVWEQHDAVYIEASKAKAPGRETDARRNWEACSWVDVVQKHKSWVMLF